MTAVARPSAEKIQTIGAVKLRKLALKPKTIKEKNKTVPADKI